MAAFSRLFILLLVLTFSFDSAVRGDVIVEICNRTSAKDLCIEILRSDPRSQGASIKVLAEIVVEKATKGAVSAARLADSLAEEATRRHDQVLASRLSSCAKNLYTALDKYTIALQLIFLDKYYYAHERAVEATTELETCTGSFEKPPAEPAQFKLATDNQYDLAVIAMVYTDSI